MPKYTVTIRQIITSGFEVEIEADDMNEAIETAENSVAEGTLTASWSDTTYDNSAELVEQEGT